ncbi:hypothetical protein TeGR_g4904 [Tetraparma gracilis]|uniref:5'-nucleotidase n=1 Tax=Tetraparma gracilis TaxID=2962635 RepID=A0ABQ6M3L9_9STRA|nr:hypothetical protein TeGR_g4904 [Tetraparma gracilis]
MEKSLSKISEAYGQNAAQYMNSTATPLLSVLTKSLLKEQPADPARHLWQLLGEMLGEPPAGAFSTPGKVPPPVDGPMVSSLTVLHFNDVYNIEGQSREPVGGAARFVTMVDQLRAKAKEDGSEDPLVLFSGDAFNPSLMSTITKGKQMVPVLNASHVDVACMGNHDFDFGIENLESLTRVCDFPWLLSNVKFVPTGRNLAEGESFVVLNRGGRRIGVMGLVEFEWMATLSTIDEEDVEYEPFVDCARRLAKVLREEHHCHSVIALTHMRVPNDEKLACEAGDVLDLICAGHDHHYDVKPVGPHGTYVLKSGTDFRDLTKLQLNFVDNEDGSCTVKVTGEERKVIDSSVPEDPGVKAVVNRYLGVLGAEMEKKIGHSNVELESRFAMIRTQETNLGNFITDIMRRGTDADVAILNSGTLRADALIPAGDILMKDMVAILPMVDETCVIEMTGEQLHSALENGVSQYPRLEGRFPQVSGVSFVFDAELEPGARVDFGSIKVKGEKVGKGDKFKVVTKAYLAKGKDGYDVFKDCPVLLDEESAPVLPTLVRNTFTELSIVNGFKANRRGSVLKSAEKWKRRTFHATPTKKAGAAPAASPGNDLGVEEGGEISQGVSHGIHPRCEDRIICINPAEIDAAMV